MEHPITRPSILLTLLLTAAIIFTAVRLFDLGLRELDYFNCLAQLRIMADAEKQDTADYRIVYRICDTCRLRVNAWRLWQ